jgi:hypothetical protein
MSEEIKILLTPIDIYPSVSDEQIDACPTCGNTDLQIGYGMAGGSLGVYGYCDPCGRVVWKCKDESL